MKPWIQDRNGTTPAGPQKARLVACSRSKFHGFYPANETCPDCPAAGRYELLPSESAKIRPSVPSVSYAGVRLEGGVQVRVTPPLLVFDLKTGSTTPAPIDQIPHQVRLKETAQ